MRIKIAVVRHRALLTRNLVVNPLRWGYLPIEHVHRSPKYWGILTGDALTHFNARDVWVGVRCA